MDSVHNTNEKEPVQLWFSCTHFENEHILKQGWLTTGQSVQYSFASDDKTSQFYHDMVLLGYGFQVD